MTEYERGFADAISTAAALAQEWVNNFGQHEIRHVSAQTYARDAMADLRDLIAALKPGTSLPTPCGAQVPLGTAATK